MSIRKFPLRKHKSSVEQWYNQFAFQNASISRALFEMWSDLFAPNSTKEVAVHHEKLREVTEVCMKMKTKTRCILVITGPPGSSKSTCLLTVCRTLGFSVPLVWAENEPGDSDAASGDLNQFKEFLFKSTRYSSCSNCSKSIFSPSTSQRPVTANLVIIESLPSELSDKPNLFHDCIRSVLPSIVIPTLLAFVLTKSSSNSNSGVAATCNFDSATLSRIFPAYFKQELGIHQIEFNPVAPLIMSKALSRVVALASNELGVPAPPKSFIQRLVASSSGDIRLAINNLQFALMPETNAGKKFGLDQDLFERDAGLGVFHALGKILHAKRLKTYICDGASFLPPHLQMWKRTCLSFNLEVVLDHSGLPGDDVVAWLHENYPVFHDTPEASFGALEWISYQMSWADAHLSGGMNWRLGLAPAADRNSSFSGTGCAAGSHYAALAVARAISLWPSLKATGSRFRPLKPPQSKQVESRRRDLLGKLKLFCESSIEERRVRNILLDGLRWSLLDRLPLELAALGPRFSGDAELISSICRFRGLKGFDECGFHTASQSAAPFQSNGFAYAPTAKYHWQYGADDDADARMTIDENFSD